MTGPRDVSFTSSTAARSTGEVATIAKTAPSTSKVRCATGYHRAPGAAAGRTFGGWPAARAAARRNPPSRRAGEPRPAGLDGSEAAGGDARYLHSVTRLPVCL